MPRQNNPGPVSSSAPKKKSDWGVRTFWTIVLLGVLAAVVILRQPAVYVAAFVIILNGFREMNRALNFVPQQKEPLRIVPMEVARTVTSPLNVLPWIQFLIIIKAMYLFALEDVFRQFFSPEYSAFVYHYWPFCMYMSWCTLFVIFVLSLSQENLRTQVASFGWSLLTALWCCFFGCFFLLNANEGMFWLLVPFLCINANDIFAYIWGRTFGKTSLIPKLSPNKTVEGFVGAAISTVVVAVVAAHYCTKFEPMWCSFKGLGLALDCQNVALYTPSVNVAGFYVAPVAAHAIVLALFASLVAPFGGFFASAVKRSVGIKDFGSLIPGHGGMTDRMDCQMFMGCFTYLYVQTFVV